MGKQRRISFALNAKWKTIQCTCPTNYNYPKICGYPRWGLESMNFACACLCSAILSCRKLPQRMQLDVRLRLAATKEWKIKYIFKLHNAHIVWCTHQISAIEANTNIIRNYQCKSSLNSVVFAVVISIFRIEKLYFQTNRKKWWNKLYHPRERIPTRNDIFGSLECLMLHRL